MPTNDDIYDKRSGENEVAKHRDTEDKCKCERAKTKVKIHNIYTFRADAVHML